MAENPDTSFYLDFDYILTGENHEGMQDTRYMTCACGGTWTKKQRFRNNVPQLSQS